MTLYICNQTTPHHLTYFWTKCPEGMVFYRCTRDEFFLTIVILFHKNPYQPFFGAVFFSFFLTWFGSVSFMQIIKTTEMTTIAVRLKIQVVLLQLTAVS